jgi:hypothetical protein
MDQVRAIAKSIWQQRFWVLSVLGLIIAVVCWKMAASSLDTKFASRKSTIEGQFNQISTLAGKPVHPNTGVNEKNQEAVDEQTKIVNTVWQELYNKQKQSVLKWPKELGEDFLTYIETLKFKDPIDSRFRSIYQNYIGKRFDGLLEIVKARKIEEGAGGAYGGGRGGEYGGRGGGGYTGEGAVAAITPGANQDYLVEWADQDKLRAKLAFATNKPTALQIWVTQEDLWVYETLLRVIANTNKERGSTRPDNAAIRTILSLEVGAGASIPSTAHVYMPAGGADAAGGGYGGEGGASDYGRGGGYGGEGGASDYGRGGGGGEYGRGGGYGMGGEAGDPAAMDAALLTNRYLDDAGAPLADGAFGPEFRQLPIKMELEMDQRYIPTLLLESANSPLPIEVKQVRINPQMAMAGLEGTAGGGYGGTSSLPSGITLNTNDPNNAIVEIRGVVFIYNEPTTDAAPAEAGTVDSSVAITQ